MYKLKYSFPSQTAFGQSVLITAVEWKWNTVWDSSIKTRNGSPWVALKDCTFSSDSKVTVHSQDWNIGQKDPGSDPWLDIMSDRSCLLLPRLFVSHFTETFYKLCSGCHWPVSAAFCPQLHFIMSDTFQRAMSNCSKFIVTTCFFVCFWLVIFYFLFFGRWE